MQAGVLERQPISEWVLPSFIKPKENRTVCFLGDFWEVIEGLVRKPFPIPKISKVLQELEGFSFATALDLNMGYYTIRLDPIQMHPKLVPLSLLGENIPTSNYLWVLQVLKTYSKEKCQSSWNP
jgi:hypothetical protein